MDLKIQLEAIFNPHNIDDDCDKIANEISIIGDHIKDILKIGLYNEAITIYLQLMNSLTMHFVEDEHYCYFDDVYSPEYALKSIYDNIVKYNIGEENQKLLDIGHSKIMDSECYLDYGYPSYI